MSSFELFEQSGGGDQQNSFQEVDVDQEGISLDPDFSDLLAKALRERLDSGDEAARIPYKDWQVSVIGKAVVERIFQSKSLIQACGNLVSYHTFLTWRRNDADLEERVQAALNSRKSQAPRKRQEIKDGIIGALRSGETIGGACAIYGLSYYTIRLWRQKDAQFDSQIKGAQDFYRQSVEEKRSQTSCQKVQKLEQDGQKNLIDSTSSQTQPPTTVSETAKTEVLGNDFRSPEIITFINNQPEKFRTAAIRNVIISRISSGDSVSIACHGLIDKKTFVFWQQTQEKFRRRVERALKQRQTLIENAIIDRLNQGQTIKEACLGLIEINTLNLWRRNNQAFDRRLQAILRQ